MQLVDNLLEYLKDYPWALTLVQLGGLFLVIWLANVITRSLLVRALTRVVRATPTGWDDSVLSRATIARLANIVPALVAYHGIVAISSLSEQTVSVVRSIASVCIVLAITRAIGSLMSGLVEVYERRDPERARSRPIKGYLQVLKLVMYIFTVILIVAILFDRDPVLVLSGLGAMTAVLMLVFKDTILSLVASIQLSSNDMLRVGDWIAMPQLHADGFAIDISLHTVKVQNWDRTITTLPTWRLISESFTNWRGMFEGGGRQIKRSLYLDQQSVHFLSPEELDGLQRFALITDYLDRKRAELESFNEQLISTGKNPVNSRHLTNLGTFRAYVQAYIEAHPDIHTELFRLVRQLQPGPTGVPLEIYCYTSKTAWADYERIQGDIFDHLYAILPEFGLRVFQQPAGTDLVQAVKRWVPEQLAAPRS